MLVLLTGFTYIGILYYLFFIPNYGQKIYFSIIKPFRDILARMFAYRFVSRRLVHFKLGKMILKKLIFRFMKVGTFLVILLAVVIYLIFDTYGSRDRLRSLVGIVGILAFGLIFSKHPSKVNKHFNLFLKRINKY